jgi:hypothetical protein
METTPSPTEICEAMLREDLERNQKDNTFPGRQAVIKRLLDRSHEMRAVYKSIVSQTRDNRAIWEFFDGVIAVSLNLQPEQTKALRETKSAVEEVEAKIARAALKLADLLRELDSLLEGQPVNSSSCYEPTSLISTASAGNYSYDMHLKDKLEGLAYQYDGKYWPRTADIIDALADQAETAEVTYNLPIFHAAALGKRSAKSDTIRAMFKRAEELQSRSVSGFPKDFHLTDACWASLANCAFDFESKDIVDAHYIKRLREKLRNRAADPHGITP